ncbi:MAG: FAD-binding oxidoreductase [bacterium]
MIERRTIKRLQKIVGRENVLFGERDLQTYEYDSSVGKGRPDVVVFPSSAEEVAEIVRLANQEKMPFVARGAGTNLSGGSIPTKGGIVIELVKMSQILEIDLGNQRAIVEPGITNIAVQNALAPLGYLYAPDPASQKVSTIGGNVGENSGGPHCFKYGVTTNHVLGMEVVLPSGKITRFGGKVLDPPGYDLVGLFVGSEGTLGIATKVTLRIMRKPEAIKTMLVIFDRIEDAGETVSAIVAAGIIPATLEMMDKTVMEAVEKHIHAGYPLDAEAVLIIELDGIKDGMDALTERIVEICREHRARDVRVASTAQERDQLWAGRRGAFGAIASLRPSYLVNDGTVPRTELPRVLKKVQEIGERYSLRIASVFHAGDGNLHPLILFDERDKEEMGRVLAAGEEILRVCAEAGGTISGEHGIGFEKIKDMPLVFSDADISAMRKVKEAFDPRGICNPGKVLPEGRGGEKAEEPPVIFGDVFSELSKIVGYGNTIASPRDAREYAVDGITPRMALFPTDWDQVVRIVRVASQKKLSIIPRGGGTSMGKGRVPERLDLIVSTNRLNRILDHDADNLTATVEAGVTLEHLQRHLAERGQFVPIDPPAPHISTIGGIVASNSSGPGRLANGSARDIVLGMKVLLPDGNVVKMGGKTVKNVAGYDMSKLFIGSMGTLGIIAEVTLRLLPLPASQKGVLASFPRLEDACGVVGSILSSELLPTSLELLDPASAKRLDAGLPEGLYVLAVGLEGVAEGVERQVEQIRSICEGRGASPAVAVERRRYRWIFGEIRNLPSPLSYPDGGRRIILRVGIPISRVGEVFEVAREISRRDGREVEAVSHAGNGIVFLTFPYRGDGDPAIFDEVSTFASKLEGYAVVESAPPEFKRIVDVWGRADGNIGLMRDIKSKFDPLGIFSPGRFLGGI